MESVLKYIQTVNRSTVKEEENHADLLEEMQEVGRLLACNDRWFQLECDEDMIESCIYQRISLQARYRHLLQLAREKGITVAPFSK